MKKKDIVVIVPVYTCGLSLEERVSLQQTVSLLSGYDIVVIKPESLSVEPLLSSYPQLKIQNFPDHHFVSLRAYNKLVLEESFYKCFERYQYMLICQLDAYIFKDELLEWANKGYDYVGAPWLPWTNSLTCAWGQFRLSVERLFWKLVNSQKLNQERYYFYQVGNGGLSLRKIEKMLDVTRRYKSKIDFLLDDNKPFFPEDIFLLLELSEEETPFKKPIYKEAMQFSMEHNPVWAYACNYNRLPFGCHNWGAKNTYPFWSKFITVPNDSLHNG